MSILTVLNDIGKDAADVEEIRITKIKNPQKDRTWPPYPPYQNVEEMREKAMQYREIVSRTATQVRNYENEYLISLTFTLQKENTKGE